MNETKQEIASKIAIVREALAANRLAAARLRGCDWFSWATGGGSNVILMASEVGVGEVLITPTDAFVLTNQIEARRFRDEEIPAEFEIWAGAWQDAAALERFVRERAPGAVASDRPRGDERELPAEIVRAKRRMTAPELTRYRQLGRETAEAITETLQAAQPSQTEFELAALGAQAMLARGIHPTLVLASGEARSLKYRHPFPTGERLGGRAMLVFCGRRHGLYANLTRFVSFRAPTTAEHALYDAVAEIEASAWQACAPGQLLSETYRALADAYRAQGHAEEIHFHHQGGTTGYLAREVIANPHTAVRIDEATAFAWNPSLPGMKIEDTIVRHADGIEILTVDPRWPTRAIRGYARPDILVRS